MKLSEAKALAKKHGAIIVRSKSGCEYRVYWDTILDSENGYVYGERTNAPAFSRRGRVTRGSIKWFDLSNMDLIKAGDDV